MTWETSEGDRWLTGAEAALVRATLAYTIDQISNNIECRDRNRPWSIGVELFDQLTATQQLVIAKTVAEHLLTQTSQTLELTAVNEATVYAVYRNLAVQIETEVVTEDDEDENWKYYWRRLTLSAFRECFPDDEADGFDDDDPEDPWVAPKSIDCSNLPQWDSVVESLADQILWDRDFEMAGSFLDSEPAKAALMKQMMGISTDYYSEISPDLKIEEVQSMLRDVRQLTHRRPR